MAGFSDERKAIESRLAAAWTTTPIRYENIPFAERSTPYVALFIGNGEGTQVSLGTPALRRWVGIIMIQIYAPQDSGTNLSKSYADTIGAIFDRAQFSSGNSGTIRCRIPSIQNIGVTNGWNQLNVTVPFIRDRQY